MNKLLLGMGLAAAFVLIWSGRIHPRPKETSKPTAIAPVSTEARQPAGMMPSQPNSSAWPIPPVTASDGELLRLARQYVSMSPEHALAWAQSATDAVLRERLLFATLRAWGEKDPAAAVKLALSQEQPWRFKRTEAALAGAVNQPTMALQIGRELLAADGVSGNAYCTALVGDLISTHQFKTALQLALDAPADAERQWLEMTFRRWAEEQPREALDALDSTPGEELHATLFQSLATGWANNDPAALARYAVSLPEGDARTFALNQAFEQWLMHDPASLGEWLNTRPPGPETDAAAARLITQTDQANRSTEVALGWVAQIQDLDLRTSALEHVLTEWAQTDLDGARKYLAGLSWLTPEKRQAILQKISLPRTPDGFAAAPD